MKATTSILAVALVMMFAACSYNDGACWLPSGQGQGGDAGGPILPAGAGGYGDVPAGGGGDGYIPCPGQEPMPLGELQCAPTNWGDNCHATCLEYGAVCYPVVENHITKRQNLLWKCCNCNPGKCWYTDPKAPESGCTNLAGTKIAPLCW